MSSIVLAFTATVGTIVASKSALNTLGYGLSSPSNVPVCSACGGGETATLGTGTAGIELVFYLHDVTCSETFSSTDPTHAHVTQHSAVQWTIGWDDGGGGCSPDGDFNDMITHVVLFGPGVSAEQSYGSGSGTHAANPTWSEAEPVNTLTGNYYTSSTDLRLAGVGIPFAFTRSYNSADATVGPMGQGWTFSYDVYLDIAPSGDVTLHAEDGQQVAFTLQPDGSFLGAVGVRDGLVANPDGTYTLTRRDQVSYSFDSGGEMTSLQDRNGQGLAFSYTAGELTSITDSAGRVITLGYTSGLLTNVELPDLRSVSYDYTDGLLTTYTDVRDNTVCPASSFLDTFDLR